VITLRPAPGRLAGYRGGMRQVYAHDAVVTGKYSATELGVALGDHHLRATPGGKLRILFAAAPDQVDAVRTRIDAVLAAGSWTLISSGCAALTDADREPARRLLRQRRRAG
jgi:hypothetical protein